MPSVSEDRPPMSARSKVLAKYTTPSRLRGIIRSARNSSRSTAEGARTSSPTTAPKSSTDWSTAEGTRTSLPITVSESPTDWQEEVVRALATRVPGGAMTVSQPCKFCGSVFFPCVCPEGKRIPHARGLNAPKIVHLWESFRHIADKAPGNLDQLEVVSAVKGLDTSVLQILGPGDAAPSVLGLAERRSNAKMGAAEEFDEDSKSILWRERGTYVVVTGDQHATQDVYFDPQQLSRLWNVLVEQQGGQQVWCNEKLPYIKSVQVDYMSESQADGDLRLLKVEGPDAHHWEVHSVREDGLAKQANFCVGQRLLKVKVVKDGGILTRLAKDDEKVSKLLDLKWEEIDLERGGSPPWCLQVHDQRSEKQPADDEHVVFPCRLEVGLLPADARAVSFEGQTSEGGVDEIRELVEDRLKQDQGATVTFKRQLKMRIDRECVRMRHKQITEEEGAEHTLEDDQLLRLWLVDNNITSSHLLFVLRKLVHHLKTEQDGFEKIKKERLQLMLSKSTRCLQIEKKLSALAGQTNRTETRRHSKSAAVQHQTQEDQRLRRELSAIESDLLAICDHVPLFFLKIITQSVDEDACDVSAPQSPHGHSASRKSRIMKALNLTVSTANAARAFLDASVRHGAEGPASNAQHQSTMSMTPRRPAGSPSHRSWRRGSTTPALDDGDVEEAVWLHLKKHVSCYLENLRGRTQRATDAARQNMSSSRDDGRVSFHEFEKTMIMNGVNWLDASQLKELFASIDTDKSGRISMGELMTAVTRLQELLLQFNNFLEERAQSGQGRLSRNQGLQEFMHTLKMGRELIGTRSDFGMLDSSISASTSFGASQADRQEHGLQQTRRSGLETTWVGTKGDDNAEESQHWIQWEFSTPRDVMAIVTQGCPDSDSWETCWVTEYRLRFSSVRDGAAGEKDSEWKWYSLEDAQAGKEPLSDAPEEAKVFEGNWDRRSKKENMMHPPVKRVLRVRLYPQEWKGRFPALRAAVFGR